MHHAKIHIGTSGWHYKHWLGNFYPQDMSAGDFLTYYSQHFLTAEINNSFYGLPQEKTMAAWLDSTPDDFLFTMKASRYLTHMKKLKDPLKPLDTFLERASVLGKKLGVILFQLPPRWRCNLERLRSFLKLLPGNYRYAFEFRDKSWLCRPVYDALQQYNAALCFYHLQGFVSPKEVTADFIYVRLHGPGEAYRGRYDRNTLNGWAGAFSNWQRQGQEIFCYFNNDEAGYAVLNAGELATMLENN